MPPRFSSCIAQVSLGQLHDRSLLLLLMTFTLFIYLLMPALVFSLSHLSDEFGRHSFFLTPASGVESTGERKFLHNAFMNKSTVAYRFSWSANPNQHQPIFAIIRVCAVESLAIIGVQTFTPVNDELVGSEVIVRSSHHSPLTSAFCTLAAVYFKTNNLKYVISKSRRWQWYSQAPRKMYFQLMFYCKFWNYRLSCMKRFLYGKKYDAASRSNRILSLYHQLQKNSPLNGGAVRWLLAPDTNTVKVGCPRFSFCLEQTILSLCVASVYSAGCLAVT